MLFPTEEAVMKYHNQIPLYKAFPDQHSAVASSRAPVRMDAMMMDILQCVRLPLVPSFQSDRKGAESSIAVDTLRRPPGPQSGHAAMLCWLERGGCFLSSLVIRIHLFFALYNKRISSISHPEHSATVKGAMEAASAWDWGRASWMMARAKKLFSAPLSIATVLHTAGGSRQLLAEQYPNSKPRAGTETLNRSTSGLSVLRNTNPILNIK